MKKIIIFVFITAVFQECFPKSHRKRNDLSRELDQTRRERLEERRQQQQEMQQQIQQRQEEFFLRFLEVTYGTFNINSEITAKLNEYILGTQHHKFNDLEKEVNKIIISLSQSINVLVDFLFNFPNIAQVSFTNSATHEQITPFQLLEELNSILANLNYKIQRAESEHRKRKKCIIP